MRFTEELSRKRFASKVVHALIPPQKIFDLAEVLSSRMRLRTEGRMWMGTHMRRGDCEWRLVGHALKLNSPDAVDFNTNEKQLWDSGGRWRRILKLTSSV